MTTPVLKEELMTEFNVEKIREDFPILSTKVHGKPLVYLDNAATTQKPTSVIEAINNYYRESNANVHRSIHYLGEAATEKFERARQKVCDFIHAENVREIVGIVLFLKIEKIPQRLLQMKGR